MTASDNTVVTVALSAIQSDTVALFCGSVLIEYCRIAWIHVAPNYAMNINVVSGCGNYRGIKLM